jgi:hypothetical protein
MKKHIREILNDLGRKRTKDFVPPDPKPSNDAVVKDLTPPPEPPLPNDLENQELSTNRAEEVRQLDFQAQENEERETLE